MDLVKEAIEVTLKTVGGAPEKWLNPVDGVLTRFVSNREDLREQIGLTVNEEPVFEFSSETSYSLITSKRVISIRNAAYYEKDLIEIDVAVPLFFYEGSEYFKVPDLLKVIDFKGSEFLIKFDSGIPLYFAEMLITNLSWKLQKGVWFLNPSKT